jgi:ABC-2 type transport system permease protein
MIGWIIKHEWRILVTDKILWIILPVYMVLIAYGVVNGVSWVSFQKTTIAQAEMAATANLQQSRDDVEALTRGTITKGTYEDPRNAGLVSRGFGYEYAVLPPSAMAPLAIGQGDLYPYYVKVTRQSLADLVNTDEIENPLNLSAGRFDLSFVFIYLYPLLILALSYNILSQEREQGTQALLLSQPVSLRRFVLGKILLRGMVVLGLTAILSLAAFVLSGVLTPSWAVIWRLLMWIVTVAIYGAFWFGLAIVVNALGKRSATNALMLMAAWLFFVILLPAILNIVAKSAYAVPSRIELVQAKRAAEDEANKSNAQLAARSADVGADAGASGGEEATLDALNQYYRDLLAVDQKAEKATLPVVARFEGQIAGQQTLTQQLRYLSPAIMAQMVMSDLAGTGTYRYQRFNAAVAQYHQQWRGYFDPKIEAGTPLSARDYDAIPRFRYQDEADGATARRLFGDLVPMMLIGFAVTAIGFGLLRRYPIAGR